MIAVVAALPEEARTLRRRLQHRRPLPLPRGRAVTGRLLGRPIALVITGEGARRARGALDALIATEQPTGILGIGLAGALSPELEPGQLIVAREIVGTDGPLPPPPAPWVARARRACGAIEAILSEVPSLLANPEQKAEHRRRVDGGPAAADLESAAWAAAAAEAGLPCLVLRIVSDAAREALPRCLIRSLRQDGSVDRWALLRRLATRPWELGAILRLAARARSGAHRLADAVVALLASGELPGEAGGVGLGAPRAP